MEISVTNYQPCMYMHPVQGHYHAYQIGNMYIYHAEGQSDKKVLFRLWAKDVALKNGESCFESVQDMSDFTEEQMFQASLIWSNGFDIYAARAMQRLYHKLRSTSPQTIDKTEIHNVQL